MADQKVSNPQPVMDLESRTAQRLARVEDQQEGWRNFQSSDGAPIRVIYGVGSGGGGIYSGGGWSVGRYAAGVYVITFTQQFASPPTVMAQQYTGNPGWGCLVQANPTATGCQIQTFNAGFSMADANYGFIAMGAVI